MEQKAKLPDIGEASGMASRPSSRRSSNGSKQGKTIDNETSIFHTPGKKLIQENTHGTLSTAAISNEIISDFSQQLSTSYLSQWKLDDRNILQRLSEVEYCINHLIDTSLNDLLTRAKSFELYFSLITLGMYRTRAPLLEHRKQILKKAVNLNYLKLLKDYWGMITVEFEAKRKNMDSTLSYIQLWDSYKESEQHIICAADNFYQGQVLFWNGSDFRDKDVLQAIYKDLCTFYLQMLESPYLFPLKENSSTSAYRIVKAILGTLHNFCHNLDSCIPELKQNNALNIVSKYREYKSTGMLILTAKASLIVSYLLNEDDRSAINLNEMDIQFLIRALRSAMSGKDYHSTSTGYHADELMAGINNVAVLDSNKQKLVNADMLPLYAAALSSNHEGMQLNAIQGLWTLSFDGECKKKIIAEPNCLDVLKKLSSSENQKIKKAVEGALWQIEGETEYIKSVKLDAEVQKKKKGRLQHIMISYQWDSKPEVLRLRDRLRKEGYRVWIDVEQMRGSSLESMAKAVESAAVVIVCLTEKYKKSNNCRQEAEYANLLQKTFVPVRMQPKYKADGWLGFVLGSTFWYDLTKREEYESKMADLIKALGNNGKVLPGEDERPDMDDVDATDSSQSTIENTRDARVTESDIVKNQSFPDHNFDVNQLRCLRWNKLDVSKWITKQKLERFAHIFKDIDGVLLCELASMFIISPDNYYSILREDYKLTLPDILCLNAALRKILCNEL